MKTEIETENKKERDKMPVANTEYKDRVFKFIFGNSNNKQWTLDLYNAINASSYDDPNAIKFNTIDDAVYVGMINALHSSLCQS